MGYYDYDSQVSGVKLLVTLFIYFLKVFKKVRNFYVLCEGDFRREDIINLSFLFREFSFKILRLF